MHSLSDIKTFTPIPLDSDTRLLSNAQIAQIMVRHREVLNDRSSLHSSIMTLSAVRDVRRNIVDAINSGLGSDAEGIIAIISRAIGLSDAVLVDCDFDEHPKCDSTLRSS